jgi:hypothetical protein
MRAWLLPCLAAALLVPVGCSGNQAEVSGTVRLDGQLVEEGSINFIPVDGTKGPGAGGVIKDGKYHIPRDKGVTVGKNRVELRAFKKTGRKVRDAVGAPGALIEERIPAFPPEYNDQSILVKEVQEGSNRIDFNVDTKRARK